MFRSSNPALSEQIFLRSKTVEGAETMTVKGTAHKTLLMLLLVVLGAVFTWNSFFQSGSNPSSVQIWMIIGGIGGLVTALILIFKPKTAPYTAPIYALLQGLLLGGLSAFMAAQFTSAIVMQAVGLTFSTFFLMLLAYQTGTIKATAKFKTGIIAATGAIALLYFISFIVRMFGGSMAFMMDSSPLSIGISMVIVAVAALNLILDFDFIEKGETLGAPKYMEWYGAFGLMVTLIWLYIEFLKLLAKLNRRN
jgi:uncharacterized YccA/Bax inhibitor family protein